MTKTTKYPDELVKKIAAEWHQLPKIDKKTQGHSKLETIKILAKEIESLQRRGYSLEWISESLCGQGIEIATPTLKSYLQRSKTKKDTPPSPSPPKKMSTEQESFRPKPDSSKI